MAVKSSWDSSVGLRARSPRTMKQCSVDARSEAQPSHPTRRRRHLSRDCGGTWKKVCISVYQVVLAVTVLSLVACAGPEPLFARHE